MEEQNDEEEEDCKKMTAMASKSELLAVQDPKLKDASVKVADSDMLKDDIFEKDSNLVF
ncbi:unnamed protein product [Mucor hiemalis]